MNKIFYLIIILFFVSCQITDSKQKLKTDIKTDATLVLRKTDNQGNIWGIKLYIIGDFNDTITLIHTNGDNVAYRHKLIGRIDTIYRTDWYSDSCLIIFENIKKPIKDLYIEYEFFD